MNQKNIAESISKIMEQLPNRSQEVLEQRFGLKDGQKRHTLESIGQGYGITRERVRQIENSAKELILSTNTLLLHTQKIVKELERVIKGSGGIMAEKNLLNHFTEDADYQDHLHFVLSLTDPFSDVKKTEYYDKI
jgi:DNA-directed RNA polymerase sigma subunit (sigma70/sigma32)